MISRSPNTDLLTTSFMIKPVYLEALWCHFGLKKQPVSWKSLYIVRNCGVILAQRETDGFMIKLVYLKKTWCHFGSNLSPTYLQGGVGTKIVFLHHGIVFGRQLVCHHTPPENKNTNRHGCQMPGNRTVSTHEIGTNDTDSYSDSLNILTSSFIWLFGRLNSLP